MSMNSVTVLMTSHTHTTIYYAATLKANTTLVDNLCYNGTVRVFQQKFPLEDDIGCHACSREALACV
jgi:hypothetical protein